MTAASVIAIFINPVSFYVVESLARRKASLSQSAIQNDELPGLALQPHAHHLPVAIAHSRGEGGL
jgi:hypothetical protein